MLNFRRGWICTFLNFPLFTVDSTSGILLGPKNDFENPLVDFAGRSPNGQNLVKTCFESTFEPQTGTCSQNLQNLAKTCFELDFLVSSSILALRMVPKRSPRRSGSGRFGRLESGFGQVWRRSRSRSREWTQVSVQDSDWPPTYL
jgi:hypothetical protein